MGVRYQPSVASAEPDGIQVLCHQSPAVSIVKLAIPAAAGAGTVTRLTRLKPFLAARDIAPKQAGYSLLSVGIRRS